MLTMTENAISTIRQLETASDVPDGTGLRIASSPTDGSLTLSLVVAPAPGDEVIEDAGAMLFLDQAAAAMLDDKTMDASVNSEGRVEFRFGNAA